jgi:hypothetical protein
MMTSFGAATLPQHRLRAVTLDSFSSTDRSLACLPLLGVVEMTRHCSNLASALHKILCRRRLQTAFPVAVSRRSPSRHAFASHPTWYSKPPDCSVVSTLRQRHQLHSVLYLAGLPPLVRHCHFTSLLQLHKCIRFAHDQHPAAATRLRSKFSPDFFFFVSHRTSRYTRRA